jgi:hypothetical protein
VKAIAKHVFTIDQAVWDSCDEGVVRQTANDMREVGVWGLPYSDGVFLRLSGAAEDGLFDALDCGPLGETGARARVYFYTEASRGRVSGSDWKAHNKEFAGMLAREGVGDQVVTGRRQAWMSVWSDGEHTDEDPQYFADLLVVLLATKGVVKQTKASKLAKLGIGKLRPQTVTTLRLDRTLTDAAGNPTGRHVRPHLRRGHIKSQFYGPQRSLRKKIWIEPIMVNVDVGAEPAPRPYRIKGLLPAELGRH